MNVMAVLRCISVFLALLFVAPAWSQAAALPAIEDFFRRPLIASPQLSPDGQRIMAIHMLRCVPHVRWS